MSTIKFEAAPLPAHAPPNPDGPRKKRKRAPAQGAADDCFTCLNRHIKCDRRRPYCSQCLDGGQDCAGYKTQLTWGVGVASRGKLRGLSLPVAGTAKTTTGDTTSPAKSKKRVANSNGSGPTTSTQPPPPTAPATKSTTTRNDGKNLRISISQIPVSNEGACISPYAQRSGATRDTPFQNTSHSGHANASPSSLNIYGSIHGASPVSATFHQNVRFPPSYDNRKHAQLPPYPTSSPTAQFFPAYASQHQLSPVSSNRNYHASSGTAILQHPGYHQPTQMPYVTQAEFVNQTVYAPRSAVVDSNFSSNATNAVEEDVEEVNRTFNNEGVFPDNTSTSSSSLTVDTSFTFPLSGSSGVGKTPRMQYLIQYYAEVIAPVCVAFDSPSNPLRNQILGLAARSESLQHAIAALSASNIRQRSESGTLSTGKTPGARRSSFMHLSLTNEAWDDSPILTPQDRKREESLHKYAAIQMLNQQLANPHLRKDDSVLATLLMLCLFHICDSGIARFQSQFAGVKKLLNLRGNVSGQTGIDTKWMTRMFTLFDAVAATVNDREGQIDSHHVDMSAHAEGEWPCETLSGIDSRLVKPISRLGRLNVLSQGKSADSNPTLISRPVPTMPFHAPNGENDFDKFDGNGWMRIASDENFFNTKTASPSVQEQFWREWRDVRQDLQTWTFDSRRMDGSDASQPYLTDEQRSDMCNISESFRYSSLLYTERLADPKLPSTDPKIQEWVKRSLYHIKKVRADVYLLWPLFITGAECGDEQERNVIRERCLDIQKDSGFMNNSTCLTLLEKVWRGGSVAERSPVGDSAVPSTFRFRDVMLAEGNEGEWIVV